MISLVSVIQWMALLAVAPLVRGIVARVKAIIQNRQGASVWRPYQDLLKLWQKEDLVPPTVSPVFRLTPVTVFTMTAAAAAFIPVLHASALVQLGGDFLIFVYLVAFARFALMLGAVDGGSAFGGMGASREALVSTLAEAPLLLALTAATIAAHSSSFGGIVVVTLQRDAFDFSAVHALALAALALVAIAETGRIPVDNPATHLELTMIHEAMVLEYSGPQLALIEWASTVKLTLVMALIVALFAPWGMAQSVTLLALLIAVAALLLKLLLLSGAVALLESVVAKLRMYLVPDFLGVATALAVLALVFTAMSR